MSPLVAVVLALQLISLVVLLFVLHKVRRLHLASYKLVNDAEFTRRETGALFDQLQALKTLEFLIQPAKPLPPMRGWAASPDFLACVADKLLSRKPKVVIECSSGVSTIVCARALQLIGEGHVYSLEHEPRYAAITREELRRQGLEQWATVIDAPLTTAQTPTPWYSLQDLPPGIGGVGAVIVDGPPEQTATLARYPALPRLHEFLAPEAMIFVDDANRKDETDMVRRWQQEFPEFRLYDIRCEKGGALLERAT